MERNLMGAMPPKRDIRDYKYAPAGGVIDLPTEFKLQNTSIKDQGSVNSCVAHTGSEILEYLNKEVMSVGFIYGKRYLYKGQGMYLRDALKTMQGIGDLPHTDFPYNKEVPEIIDKVNELAINQDNTEPYRITSYYLIPSDQIDLIKQALYTNDCPLMASIFWKNSFVLEEGKIYDTDKNSTNGGYHCIMIYGWNEEGFLIQNSWGEDWGNNGCALVLYSVPIAECWGVIDNERLGSDISKPNIKSGFAEVLAKIVNFVLYLLDKFRKL